MSITAASTIATFSSLTPVGINGQCMERGQLSRSNLGRACMQFQPVDYSRGRLQMLPAGMRSTSVLCHASLNATCAAAAVGQTQTVTRKAPSITSTPAKEKSPQLYDGGAGFPPFQDGGGGGGGGGGGDKPSGGWVLFALLGVLGFLKDKEIEWRNRRDGR